MPIPTMLLQPKTIRVDYHDVIEAVLNHVRWNGPLMPFGKMHVIFEPNHDITFEFAAVTDDERARIRTT